MTGAINARVATVALVVADLERTTRFYCEGLGFEELQTLIIGNELAHVAGVEGEFRLHERFIRGGDVVLNLLSQETPKPTESRAELRYGRLGFSHIVIRVDDLEATIARIRDYDGSPIEESRSHFDNPDPSVGRTKIIQALDPEGNRLELIEMPESAFAFMMTPKIR